MKKTYIIISTLLILSVGIGAMQHKAARTPAPVNPDFGKEPVKCMAEIYKCYHNWEIKRGLEMTANARAIIDKIYAQNPDTIIKDPGLKLNKAYQVKSTLYTLAGMLYYRNALSATRKSGFKENAFILDKVKKGEAVTDKDLETLAAKIDSKSLQEHKKNDIRLSRESFLVAIKSDKQNPAPHFQLATLYRMMGDRDSLNKAEACYFSAARLGVAEGDIKAKDRALESLTQLNPQSRYIAQISALETK